MSVLPEQVEGSVKRQRIPPELVAVEDYERLAPEFIPGPSLAYIAGGSGREYSLRRNREAFNDVELVPRLLSDVSGGNTRLQLCGQDFAHPILLAPVAAHKLVHPEGELATAQGAGAMEACLVASTQSSCALEDIASVASGKLWFQLYFQPRREDTLALLRRAEAAGYQGLMLTLDTPIQSQSLRARRAGFVMPVEAQPVNLQHQAPLPQVALAPHQSLIFQGLMSEAPSAADVMWLMGETTLPVLVKGVMGAEDARHLVELGVEGLVVSNHGGRALDGVAATLDVLPEIRQAVGADFPLLLDGGIRSGTDVFKALALGANAVMVGRPQIYGLAVAGALGVAHLIKLLREELELCMALTGCPNLASITRAAIRMNNKG